MRTNWRSFMATIVTAAIMLTGCTSSGKTLAYEADPNMKATLKVMVSDQRWFMRDYGDLFKAQYPNIELEFIPYDNHIVERTLDEQKPDVMALTNPDYNLAFEQGRLYDLNTVIRDDRFGLDRIYPGIIDALRQQGGGKLYGLPPTYSNLGIYFNKDLFDQYKVPYPTDNMTWEELFQLAGRFSGLAPDVYGLFSTMDPGYLSGMIARSNDLSQLNSQTLQVTMNTEPMRKILEMMLEAYRTHALMPPMNNTNEYDPFIMGKSAMVIDFDYYINNYLNPAKVKLKEKFQLNWDIVTPPSDTNNREVSSSIFYPYIYTVNAHSSNVQAAWELVKFVNSDKLARIRSKSMTYEMLTRTEYIYNIDGKRMEAFFSQRPNVNVLSEDYSRVPDGFHRQFFDIINQEITAIRATKKPINEAMESIQKRGQETLDMAVLKQKSGG